MAQSKPSSSAYTLLVNLSVLLTLLTVILSAYIRLSVNGLDCEPWPECYGYVGPVDQYHASASFTDAMPQKPHGTARAMHRVIASVLGIFIVLILISAIRRRNRGGPGIGMPLAVFGITVFLSVLGYSTPSPWLPAVTLGNLLGGMLMLALLWWMSQRSMENSRTVLPAETAALKPWAVLGLVIVVLQISLGAWTSASFAGPACPGLGTCNGEWLPVNGIAEGFSLLRELQVNHAGLIVRDDSMTVIHMIHRWGAVFSFIYMLWLGINVFTAQALKMTGISILIFTVVGLGLGMTSVALELPLLVVTAHNAVAALLLLAITHLNQLLFRRL